MSPKTSAGKTLLSPSILSADFAALGAAAVRMERAGADWLHVDVMDGHFVPNITVGPVVVKSLKKYTSLPLDVHVMIMDPLKFAGPFAQAGAWGLTFHYEAVHDTRKVIAEIKKQGMKVGLSIRPSTPATALMPYLKDVNHVLIMTVEPGFGGQSFMPEVIPKITRVAGEIKRKKLKCLIEVDGGINVETGRQCVAAGARVLVAGNAIFNAPDPEKAVRDLKAIS